MTQLKFSSPSSNDDLTKIVNFPVSNSDWRGSLRGSKHFNPSRCLVSSCCSKSTKALRTSNFRAHKNLTAVDQDTGPSFLLYLAFTFSMKSFVACNKKKKRLKSVNETPTLYVFRLWRFSFAPRKMKTITIKSNNKVSHRVRCRRKSRPEESCRLLKRKSLLPKRLYRKLLFASSFNERKNKQHHLKRVP